MLLQNKIAVVYGAAGAIGGAVARAFAREGAKVFLTGRTYDPVERVAREIVAAGGSAESEEVDALNEAELTQHLESVVGACGRVDISFNAIGLPTPKVVGVSLLDLDLQQFTFPIRDYTASYFLTARSAARYMVPKKSGVIMTVTALPARRGTTLNGGYGSAHAAKEALTRDLSAELSPHGLRVVGLRPHGMPETQTMKHIFEMKGGGLTWEQFQNYLASTTHPRRVMNLNDVGGVAAFMASEQASGMTGTTVNLTMGSVDD